MHPTCLVEFGDVPLGNDLLNAYERSGSTCSVSAAGCCGAPSLHAGDIGRFARLATRTVTTLADELRRHEFVVVAQPGCADTLRRHAVDHVRRDARADAQLVAERILDPAGPLLERHPSTAGAAGRTMTLHRQAPGADEAAHAVLSEARADVDVTTVGTGITTTWDLRADHDDVVTAASGRFDVRLRHAPGLLVGSNLLSNAAIAERIGREPVDPIVALVDDGADASRAAGS